MQSVERWLRVAFVAGAVVDGLAAVAMLVPRLAPRVWGLSGLGGEYRFAMGYGAALMLGWTALLIWAARRPIERRAIALLTVVPVLAGLVLTELVAVLSGLVGLWQLFPMLLMQHVAMLVLGSLYFRTDSSVRRLAHGGDAAQRR